MALDHPLNVPRTDPDAHLHTYIATAHLPSAIMQSSFSGKQSKSNTSLCLQRVKACS